MNAEIIAVGSELLLGQIVNTNARFLSSHLADMGINMYYHTVVGDNPSRLASAIKIAQDRSNFIIFTGGLGPTKDDLTKETVAKQVGKKLVFDQDALDYMEEYFKQSGRQLTENSRKQALVIEGTHVLKNEHGLAPGMLFSTGEHTYLLLPGPPREMEPMFTNFAKPILKERLKVKERIISKVLRFFGIGEAQLETDIEDLIDAQNNPTIALLASDGEVTVRLTAKHESVETAMQLISDVEKKILERTGKYFYGYDDTSLMEELSKLLKEKQLTIAAAESLTGGMFQKELTAVPGASSLLIGGVVCYSPQVKHEVLKVKQETIDTEGVVSASTARQLAENVAELMKTDIGISFTGVAGPEALEGKPAGTVYVGIAIKGQPTKVELLNLSGNRTAIRKRTVKYGCYYLLKYLK